MDCAVDARLDFVFIKAQMRGGWTQDALAALLLSCLSHFTHSVLLLSNVSTLTHVFHHCAHPRDLSGQIVIEVTVSFIHTKVSI